MKIKINSCAEESLSHGTSAAIPIFLGFAMGCVIPSWVLLLHLLLVGSGALNASCILLLDAIFIYSVVSVVVLSV